MPFQLFETNYQVHFDIRYHTENTDFHGYPKSSKIPANLMRKEFPTVMFHSYASILSRYENQFISFKADIRKPLFQSVENLCFDLFENLCFDLFENLFRILQYAATFTASSPICYQAVRSWRPSSQHAVSILGGLRRSRLLLYRGMQHLPN